MPWWVYSWDSTPAFEDTFDGARSDVTALPHHAQSRLRVEHPQGGPVLGQGEAASHATSRGRSPQGGEHGARSARALLRWLARPVLVNTTMRVAFGASCTILAWCVHVRARRRCGATDKTPRPVDTDQCPL